MTYPVDMTSHQQAIAYAADVAGNLADELEQIAAGKTCWKAACEGSILAARRNISLLVRPCNFGVSSSSGWRVCLYTTAYPGTGAALAWCAHEVGATEPTNAQQAAELGLWALAEVERHIRAECLRVGLRFMGEVEL